MPGSGAPLATFDGQVFWLMATIDSRAAFPRLERRSGMVGPGVSPNTAAALRRILTGFPLRPPAEAGGTPRYSQAYPIIRGPTRPPSDPRAPFHFRAQFVRANLTTLLPHPPPHPTRA